MSGVIHHRQRRQVRISRCFSPIAPSRDCDGLHGFYTLSSVQLSLRSVLTTLTSCFAKPNAVEADLPRHVPSRPVTGEALTETNHTPTFRLSSQGHRRAGSVTALSAAGCVPDGPHHGFTLETETAATCALLQKHAPTIRNAFHQSASTRSHAAGFQAIDAVPTLQRTNRSSP